MGMMINRRRVMGGKKLPYDAEIEYLMSDGNAYIDTGIYPDIQTDIHLEGYFKHAASTTRTGCRKGIKDTSYILGSTSNNFLRVDIGNTQNALQARDAESISIFPAKKQAIIKYVGQETLSTVTGLGTLSQKVPYSFTLFALHSSSVAVATSMKISLFKCFVNDILIAHLIPVRVGSVGYMYDKVSKQLFGNNGTGAFILGPDKN